MNLLYEKEALLKAQRSDQNHYRDNVDKPMIQAAEKVIIINDNLTYHCSFNCYQLVQLKVSYCFQKYVVLL